MIKVLKWLAKASTVVGFIGTMIGIWLALKNANKPITSTGDRETENWVSTITNDLSNAFMPTLVCFGIGLILYVVATLLEYNQN